MKKKPNKDSLTQMCEMLERQPRSLKGLLGESIVFNEDDDESYAPRENDDVTLDDLDVDGNDEQPMGEPASNGSQDKVNQIRKIALQGIAELADQPTSKHYDLFKKIWGLVDKSIEQDTAPADNQKA